MAKPQTPFNFDEWLETGTVAQRTVELHNDRSIPDRMNILLKRLEVAEKVAEAEDAEASVTDVPEVATINAELDALTTQWEASKETWIVRALSVDEVKALREKFPTEDQPREPGRGASKSAIERWTTLAKEWAERTGPILEDLQYAQMEASIVSLTTAKGSAVASGTILDDDFRPAVTADQLRALHSRAGRQNDVKLLLAAAQEATASDVEVPAPFSRPSSRPDRS